jgi:predicted nucleic acid-binding Zn ribbon protein
MPTYLYETLPEDGTCPTRFEVEQRMSAAALTHHPDTGIPVRRVISGGLGFFGAEANRGSAPEPMICPSTGKPCGCQ